MPADTASDLVQRAKAALGAGRAEEANTLLDRAIAAIGRDYRAPGTIDDTGMKLTLADSEARQSHFERAANIKAGVAEARLAQAAAAR